MKIKSARYQNGSIQKREKANGFTWRFTYRDADGKQRVLSFDGRAFPKRIDVQRETARLREAINVAVPSRLRERLTVPMAIDMYLDHIKARLKARTVSTYIAHGRIISLAYRDMAVDDLNGLQIESWLTSLNRAGSQRANIRNLFGGAVNHAMLAQRTTLAVNPLRLIRLRGTTKRQKKIVVLTPAEFIRLVACTKPPYDRIVLVVGFLGLRIGEALALRWSDFDEPTGTVEIQRSISGGHLSTAKTTASNAVLPVSDSLMRQVAEWHSEAENEWLFPSRTSASGVHGHSGILVQKVLHPACDRAGIPHIGWHALRHSYRTWMDAARITTGAMKDLMRHSDVSTTMNVYGRTLSAEMREASDAIAGLLGR